MMYVISKAICLLICVFLLVKIDLKLLPVAFSVNSGVSFILSIVLIAKTLFQAQKLL